MEHLTIGTQFARLLNDTLKSQTISIRITLGFQTLLKKEFLYGILDKFLFEYPVYE